jgi:hypothetical protein
LSDPTGSLLRAEEIARINVEHLITTPLKPADLLFVFGTPPRHQRDDRRASL